MCALQFLCWGLICVLTSSCGPEKNIMISSLFSCLLLLFRICYSDSIGVQEDQYPPNIAVKVNQSYCHVPVSFFFLSTTVTLPKTNYCPLQHSFCFLMIFSHPLFICFIYNLNPLDFIVVTGFLVFFSFVCACDCRATTLQTSLVLNLVVLVVL